MQYILLLATSYCYLFFVIPFMNWVLKTHNHYDLTQVYYYYPFSAVSDPAKLYNDLRWNITRPQGFEAVMRVRSSQVSFSPEFSNTYSHDQAIFE